MKPSKSSKQWLKEHFDDEYVKKAHVEGYRSRAVYKLKEVDEREHLLRPGMTIVDLGAAPGGWAQYAAQKLEGQGTLVALDLLPMDEIAGVEFIVGDFREDLVLQQLMAIIPKEGVDLVISDMAPNITGIKTVDQPGAIYLTELALDFSLKWLKPGGHFLVKAFVGADFDELVKKMRPEFEKVITVKPKASRDRSSEVYLLGFAKA